MYLRFYISRYPTTCTLSMEHLHQWAQNVERCANYEHAYCLEVERNKQINKAYQLLVCQHSKALNDLRLRASKF
jgi:hypothetical protein